MKVATYTRTSTNYQEKGLESQSLALKRFCEAQGFDNIIHFSDEGVSGLKSSRPELNRLIQDVRDRKVGTVIVYSFSRLARSVSHLLELLEIFRKHEVTFISITERLDSSTPSGKAVTVILAAIAEFERDLIVQRVRTGLDNARAKGKQLGRPKQRNSNLIRELRSQGKSFRQIARLTKYSLSTISKELRSPIPFSD